MPVYDFKCSKCGREEEKVTHICVDDFKCECGGRFERQFTPTAITLMGRSKPRGFKWYPEELNPKKDRLKALLDQNDKRGNLTRIQVAEVKRLRKELDVV